MCQCQLCAQPPLAVLPINATVDADQATTPCFVNQDSAALPEFTALELGVYGHPCFTQVPETIQRCLTPGDIAPPRGSPGTPSSRTLFLLGDSHAAAMVATLSAATKGAFNVAWSTTLFGGGFNGPWPQTYCNHGGWEACQWARDVYYSSYTASYVSTVRSTLESQLQPGDVVAVVTAELRMPHADFVNSQVAFLRDFAAAVKAKGARLLLIADVPKLWEDGKNCLTPSTGAQLRGARPSPLLIPCRCRCPRACTHATSHVPM